MTDTPGGSAVTQFASGTSVVYVVFDYSDMQNDEIRVRVYDNVGNVLFEQVKVYTGSGTESIAISPEVEAFADGRYLTNLYSGLFPIRTIIWDVTLVTGEATHTPTPTPTSAQPMPTLVPGQPTPTPMPPTLTPTPVLPMATATKISLTPTLATVLPTATPMPAPAAVMSPSPTATTALPTPTTALTPMFTPAPTATSGTVEGTKPFLVIAGYVCVAVALALLALLIWRRRPS